MTAHDKDAIDKGKLTYSLEGGKIYIKNIMHIQLLVLNYPVYFYIPPLNMQHYRVSLKTGWVGIRIMCQSGATCLPVDCCFSVRVELHVYLWTVVSGS